MPDTPIQAAGPHIAATPPAAAATPPAANSTSLAAPLRSENVTTDVLSLADINALIAAEDRQAFTPRAYATSELDSFLSSLDGQEKWSSSPAGDDASETLQIVRGVENTVCNIDDSTVEMRHHISNLGKEIKTLQSSIDSIHVSMTAIKLQNVTILKEIRKLRLIFADLPGAGE